MGAPRENLAAPRENFAAPRENLAAPRENLAAPRENLAAPRENLAAPREKILPGFFHAGLRRFLLLPGFLTAPLPAVGIAQQKKGIMFGRLREIA